jgi:hypothetical protein
MRLNPVFVKGGDVYEKNQIDFVELLSTTYSLHSLHKEIPKMLNMQAFHKLLSTASEKKDSYLDALSAITRISPDKLDVLNSGLGWDQWFSSTTEPAKA